MANINIGGRLHSTATGNTVAGANEILDDSKGKKQSVINQETDAALAGKQATIDDLSTIRSGAAAGATAYQKPSGGVPASDMASGVQTSLGKADTAYQKPGAGVPKTDLESGVQASLELADSAIQARPQGEITPVVVPADYATREELGELEAKVGKYLGLPAVEEQNGWVAASTFHYGGGTHKALFIGAGKSSLKVTAGAKNCYFFIAKSYSVPSSSVSPDFATGETSRREITSGTTETISLPVDARYIIVGAERNGENFLPAQLFIDGLDYNTDVKKIQPEVELLSGEVKSLEYDFTNANTQSDSVSISNEGEAEICFIIPETHTSSARIFSSSYLVAYFNSGGENALTCRFGPGTYLYGLAELQNNYCYVLRLAWKDGVAKVFLNGNLIREAEYAGTISGTLNVGKGGSSPSFVAQIIYMSINGVLVNVNGTFDKRTYSLYERSEVKRVNSVTKTVNDALSANRLPLYPPAPQLPANTTEGSDFNCETVTAPMIQDAFEAVISKVPSYATIYEKVGRDCTGTDDLKTYILTRKNRFAWKAGDALYAWQNGENTVVYIDSCCPFVGGNIYSDTAKTSIIGTIASYEYVNGVATMIDNNGVSYFRAENLNVETDIIFSQNTTSVSIDVYDRKDNRLGYATSNDGNSCIYNGKTYNRCVSFDYHTDAKFTIMMVANVHGPQSDPMEPSVILYRLAKDLCTGPGVKMHRFLNYLKQHARIVLLPVANPSGIRLWVSSGRNGRTNANNININRNYDTLGWSVNPSEGGNLKGTYPGDQPETQYIMNVLNVFKPDAAFDVHCYGYAGAEGSSTDNLSRYGGLISIAERDILNQVFLDAYGVKTWSFEQGDDETECTCSAYLKSIGIPGSTIELWPGKSTSESAPDYDGEQHTAQVMEFDYMSIINSIKNAWHTVMSVDFTLLGIQ